MTIISILGDGTVYPPLRNQDLVIKIQDGKVYLGRFDRQRFLTEPDNYLNEPKNAADLKADVLAYISSEMPGSIWNRKSVHIICPSSIAGKAVWKDISNNR